LGFVERLAIGVAPRSSVFAAFGSCLVGARDDAVGLIFFAALDSESVGAADFAAGLVLASDLLA
jgi:hypothetical protein